MGPARALPSAGNGRLSVATAAAFRASVRGTGDWRGTGRLSGFSPHRRNSFRNISFSFWRSGGWRGSPNSGAFSCGAFRAARGIGATTLASGVVGGRVHSQSRGLLFLAGMGWGGDGGFRRERVVQRRWSHSRPVRFWLRPGLAGPAEPTRAGNAARASPRTPELGLHGRTKAAKTRLLDAKI
ncbi:hypothetical protein NN561_000007 [Cricetulus griseus]